MKYLTLNLLLLLISCTTGNRNNPCDPNSSNFQGLLLFKHPQSATISEGQEVSFIVSVTGVNINYQWQKGGDDIPGANSSSFEITSAGTTQSGSYRCIVWNDRGRDTSDAAVLIVHQITYTIAYDGNGNTSGTVPSPQTKIQSVTLSLSDNTGNLVKNGSAFAGWNTTQDGNGITYAGGTNYTVDADVKLFAKWITIPTYIITYDGNGNTGGSIPSPQTKTQGVVLKLSDNTGNLIKISYIFSGWNTASNGNSTNYAVGASYTRDENVKMYAKWISVPTTVTDIDGNVYKTVVIGTQVWTVENLKTTKYNDGTAIPLVSDNYAWAGLSTPGYCWYANDIVNKVTYGALYNWYVVNAGKLAPAGWHVPTDADWNTLSKYLGGNSLAGGKLKEAGTIHWQSQNIGATNTSGFSALPGGFRNGYYSNKQYYMGSWWSSTEYDNMCAWDNTLYADSSGLYRNAKLKGVGISVRLVRD